MTDIDLDRLEALAKAATPGEWEYATEYAAHGDLKAEKIRSKLSGDLTDDIHKTCDALFIEAFQPLRALSLLATVRTLTKERDEARVKAEKSGIIIMNAIMNHDATKARAAALEAALEPFKNVAEFLASETEGFEADDKFKLCIVDDRDGKTITVSDDLTHGHFRTALEASR